MMKLRTGYRWNNTTVLGPGHRFVIWVQGCQKRCYRCTAPELQPEGGTEVLCSDLAKEILDTPLIDGITISGGEPLLQAEALIEVLDIILSQKPDFTVILFTGFKIEEITDEKSLRLLRHVDLLIDGEYINELNYDNIGLRGSKNQRLIFLSDRLLSFQEELTKGERKREMHLLNPTELLTIGIATRQK